MELEQRIDAAANFLRSRISRLPSIGLILGSGLGDYCDTLENPVTVPFSQIPDFPQATAPGHEGAFVFAGLHGKTVVALKGRLHYYEGHSQRELTIPVRVMARLGVKRLLLTNAAGGLDPSFSAGTLMLIRDHINFSGSNPLIGPNLDSFGPRFPDMTDIYTASLREEIKRRASQAEIPLAEGVYIMYSGPNYETPAEIRFFQSMGGSAVGMSTVPEALVASHCGMEVAAVSCITNMAAGILPVKLSHQEVLETAARVKAQFVRLVDLILELM